MKKIVTVLLACCLTVPAFAWRHGISFGYGRSQEVGYGYDNSGFFLHGIFYRFNPVDPMLYFSADGSLGFWHASTRRHKRLNTAAASLAARAYFMPPAQHVYRPYLLLTFGPVYLSQKHFGEETQGSHFAFQTTLGGGMEYVPGKQGVDLNLRMIHYCNAGLASPNQGFDVFYVLSVGYLF
jgi:hypothetical protein